MTLEMPGRLALPKNSRFTVRSAEEAAEAALRRLGLEHRLGGHRHRHLGRGGLTVIVDRGRVREHVAGEVGCDHDLGAERARSQHRHRVDQRAVDQPAIADQDGSEDAGQGVGGAHGVDHAAVGQPDLVAGAHFGRDAGELDREVLDRGLPQRRLEFGSQLAAADQARPLRRMSR